MSLLDGEHYHIFKFEDSDPKMPYGTYLGNERGLEFAQAEFDKVKAKHEGAWFAICDGDCLTRWRTNKVTVIEEPVEEEEIACAS